MQPLSFLPNHFDHKLSPATAVSSDANASFLKNLFDRSYSTGFVSANEADTVTDAFAVTIDITPNYPKDADSLFLLDNNILSYKIQYKEDPQDPLFTTLKSDNNNSSQYLYLTFPKVKIGLLRLVLYSTRVANKAKTIRQLILTEKIGKFSYYPVSAISHSLNQESTQTLKGLQFINDRSPTLDITVSYDYMKDGNDLELFDTLYFKHPSGFLFYPCGGNEEQFAFKTRGWRLQDIYLVKAFGNLDTSWADRQYISGQSPNYRLVEIS